MSYEERKYRSILNEERFNYFNVVHLETDLWIGVGDELDQAGVKQRITNDIIELRAEIESFILRNQEFSSSLLPLNYKGRLPDSIQELIDASAIAGTGPMAGIAGLFSEYIGKKLMPVTTGAEILVENGGDIFLSTKNPLVISIYAGNSPLSNKMAINVPDGEWGICTSSGTVGHSTSFGKADAVTIVAKSTVLADAIATQIANQVQSADDIQDVLKDSNKYKDIEGVVIICEDKIGITGNLEILPAN